MRSTEAKIKTYSDDLNQVKAKLTMIGKKDTGNYTVRDFSDELYNSEALGPANFVQGMHEGFSSELFTNLLCVVPKAKQVQFFAEINSIMADYYEAVDATELKRRPDVAKLNFAELKEKHDSL